jgi:RimJ/RimL family protein N-acetyltransferase
VRAAIAFDARVWAASIDDGAPSPGDWRPGADPRIVYVVASDAGRPVATFTLLPQNSVTYEIHVDRAFGPQAARAHREIFGWAFEHTPARRIVASIPADNPIAIRAARRAGMEQYGVNLASFLRRGVLQDQILFGVSKCHQ